MLHAVWIGAESYPVTQIMTAVGEGYSWEVVPQTDNDALRRGLARAEVLIANRFTAETAAMAPKLRLLQCYTSGYDGFDLTAVPQGVIAAHLSGHEAAVAEHALALWLAVVKQLLPAAGELSCHRWSYGFVNHGPYSREVHGTTVGLVGLGGIGTAFVRLVRGFDCRVLAVRAHPERGAPEGVEAVWGPDGLHQLLPEADMVLLAAPLNETTAHLIGADELRQMKPSAVLINIARSGLLDHDALYAALTNGTIAGAGLDVPVHHPPAGTEMAPFGAIPLERLNNVVATPHMGAWTAATLSRRNHQLIDQLKAFRDGRPVACQIPLPPRESP